MRTDIHRLEARSKELINTITLINSYDTYLRVKYYPVLKHSIALLMQYTILIEEGTVWKSKEAMQTRLKG